tara:strand:+ start:2619 stop:4583 length:1965 start_codon:yes stop_codon:yes gene_type:complete
MDEEEELDNTLIGQQEEVPVLGTEDALIGGLGLGTLGFASQTGRAPTPTPQGPLSPLAQRVAANDAVRIAAQNRPVLMGTGTSTSGVTNPRLVTGTNIVPTGQAPATTGSTSITAPKGSPTASSFDYTVNRQPRPLGTSSAISNITSNILKGIIGTPSLVLNPNEFGDSTLSGQNIRAFQAGLDIPFPDAPGSELLTNLSDVPFDSMMDDAERSVDEIPSRTVADVIAEKNARGPDATFTESELREMDAIRNIAQMDTKRRESNIANAKSTLAKQINELGTVTDDQRAVQEFLDERAERAGETPTDVITPFQDQAQLTANLFTDPSTASGQFVPRATFTLPDGTIVQEDEGGNRRQISAEQLRQFEQDMASIGQPSVIGLGRGGDAGAIKSFGQPMGVEETRAALGGRTLNEFLNAPDRTTGVSGLRTDPQGRMITPAPQPAAQTETASTDGSPNQLSPFQQASDDLQQRIRDRQMRPGETQTERDTRIAQSRTIGAQTAGMSFDDARRRAEGQLAARGIRNPSSSQVNALARSIQAGEQERLEDQKLKRDLTQARIDLLDKQLANAGIVPIEDPVLDPETGVFMQLYSDGIKRIKGNARNPSLGSTDIDNLLSDLVPTDKADTPNFKKGEIREQEIDGETYKFQFDGEKWNQI